jgi:hypothetical protein
MWAYITYGNGITMPGIDRPQTAKCAYCGLYGKLGSCDGCGAPNEPHTPLVKDLPARRPDRVWR